MSSDLGLIRNRTFDEIAVGDSASIQRTLTAQDIQLFAVLSGDVNPQHLDAEFAALTRFHGVIAHGMWGGACWRRFKSDQACRLNFDQGPAPGFLMPGCG